MKKVKIGVIGIGRGQSMMRFCHAVENAELVAICDKWEEGLCRHQTEYPDWNVAYYTDYDEFLKHDMDAVVLANYATEHAPFAVKAMKAGKHVYSEVLPVQTMKEAVELIEAVEETGKVYFYGENYCFMEAPHEMRKLYREDRIGELEYAECEYIHDCGSIWHQITYGDPNHWRNNIYSTFYCTHSLGPVIHATGLRPVSVIGFEGSRNERNLMFGSKAGQFGIEMVTLENGAIVKSIHGGLYKNSIWYTMYGSKGRMETAREDAENGSVNRIYVNADEYTCQYADLPVQTYLPKQMEAESDAFGHGGSDFYAMYHFVDRILGNEQAEIIDVYEAIDMFLPGMFAYRSVLSGNVPVEIPDLRKKEVRDLYRNDTACSDPTVAGDQLLPTFSKGTPQIEPAVYDRVRKLWLDSLEKE